MAKKEVTWYSIFTVIFVFANKWWGDIPSLEMLGVVNFFWIYLLVTSSVRKQEEEEKEETSDG